MEILYKLLKRFLWKSGNSVEAEGSFPFGNCIIRYSLRENHNEIEVYNPVKGTFLDNIAEWLMLNIGDRGVEAYNSWNEHGFSSETDYIRYKYGN